MFKYPFIQLGNLLDRVDLGGWLMLGCGVVIVGATALAPAWLELADLQAQRDLLKWQEQRLATKADNYAAFNSDIEYGEPMVMQRLGWHEFHLKPLGTEPVCDMATLRPVAIDRWMDPTGPPPPRPNVSAWRYDSRLLRMVTGEPRPWVLAFGAWLILMGLLLNPVVAAAAGVAVIGIDVEESDIEFDDPHEAECDASDALDTDGGTDVLADADDAGVIGDDELLVDEATDETIR